MSLPPLPYPLKPVSFATSYGTRPDATKAGMGPSACPLTFNFSSTSQSFVVSLQATFPFGLSNIQTLFIDNGFSPGRTTIVFPLSGETITAEAFTRGFYPVATNALTFICSNPASVSFTTTVVCYNFIIPPIVNNSTQLVLGSSNQILPSLEGTLNFTDLLSMSAVPQPIVGFVGSPFYYITGLNITYTSAKNIAYGATQVALYDSPDGGTTQGKIMWTGVVLQSSTTDTYAVMIDNSNLLLAGENALFFKAAVTPAQPISIVVNVYGGFTSVDFV